MAERRQNGGQAGTNLLFSASDFSFSVPFIPVSQPSVCPTGLPSADDACDVGEEDSFLGQSSDAPQQPPPQTFSYFSQPPGANDPFAGISQPPHTVAPPVPGARSTPPVPGPAARSTPPVPGPAARSTPPVSGPLNGQDLKPPFVGNPVSKTPAGIFPPASQHNPPPPGFLAPAPGPPQTGYNPYRQSVQSSRASPYITPPQLQDAAQCAPPHHYQGPPTHMSPPHTAAMTLPPPGDPLHANPRAAGPPVPGPPAFIQSLYEPIQPHWFCCKLVEGKELWLPFSNYDSHNLEEIYNSVQPDPESVVVSTDGGRYDVYLYNRERKAVYWDEEESEVRRCAWFYKGDMDSRFIPYSEDFSEKLEVEYKKAALSNQWHRRLEFPGGETIVMHNPKVIVQFQHSAIPDEWGAPQDGQARPRVVKRGIDDHDEIPDDEAPQADHLVFMVHGIGPVCDLRCRSIVECVDDFRTVSLKLLQTHFKKPHEDGRVSRLEFLPVHWHSALHGDATGVDRHIKKISLPSISRLRHFTNETLLDILFYNSPTYCQTIVDKVSLELNRLFQLFMSRNPGFKGGVSVAGHSLGSLILFDLLSNQTDLSPVPPPPATGTNGPFKSADAAQAPSAALLVERPLAVDEASDSDVLQALPDLVESLESLGLAEYINVFEKEKIDMESLVMCTVDDLKEMGIPLGPRKKIAKYMEARAASQAQRKSAEERRAALNAQIKAQEEAAAAKISPSDSEKGLETPKTTLPVGALVSSAHVDYQYFDIGTGQVSVRYNPLVFEPVSFFALGSPIGMFLTVRGLEKIDKNYRLPTCRGFFNIYHPLDPVAYRLEPMIVPDLDLKPVLIPHHKGRKRLHLELKESLTRMGSDLKQGFISSLRSAWQTLNDFARAHTSSAQLQAELEKVADQIQEEAAKQQEVEEEKLESPESSPEEELAVRVGMLNSGRRIDYVLQEKPIESFNEYLFALQSHLCYWESEDTALLILKEIYNSMNIVPDQLLH